MMNVKQITSLSHKEGHMETKNPLENLANRIGMYAYLAAVGGLQYWPTVRQVGIEERSLAPLSAKTLEEGSETERSKEAILA
jgi:hypothetical protein